MLRVRCRLLGVVMMVVLDFVGAARCCLFVFVFSCVCVVLESGVFIGER